MIILGSSSPRRKDILDMMGVKFKVVKPIVDEDSIRANFDIKNGDDKCELVKELSFSKLKSIEKDFSSDTILCADTLVFLGNEALGKPKNHEDAKRMLRELLGKTHEVITGVSIKKDGEVRTFSVETKVKFRENSELISRLIEEYVESGESDGKAGAYGIQDSGALFVDSIDGDYYNVVGLPIDAVLGVLK